MACIPIPEFPALPDISPFSLTPPPLPSLDLDAELCCKLLLITWTPTIPLGAITLAVPGATTIVAGANAALTAINAYLDSLPLSCPRE